MVWRRTLGVLVCAALAAFGLADGVTAQGTDDAASARQALVAERDVARSELAAVDAELAETAARLVEAEADLAARRDERAAAVTAREVATAEREEPLAVRRAIAIETYMAGDPEAMSLLHEVLDANSSMDGLRDRALYSSVVDWATETLARLDAEIEELTEQIDVLDERIPEAEAAIAELTAGQADQLGRRDALLARIADLDRRITALSRAPLTGVPVDEPSLRPILIVKIDNVGPARPQVGLAQADIVVEERVEGGLSRFAAMFQSTGSDPVGPIRSARTSDIHIFANLDAPLFAYSGSNRGVTGALSSSNLVDVGAARQGGLYYRDGGRRAPHNLFSSTTALWNAAGGGLPTPLFEYRAEGDPLPAGARPVTGVDVSYGAATAGFTWNGGGWVRSSDGRPHDDASGAPLAPENVVVRFSQYVPSPADARSPEAVVTGSGELWVLTAGQVVVGRWEQPSVGAPTRWLDASGNPIRLTPGRTWIVMPEPGRASLR